MRRPPARQRCTHAFRRRLRCSRQAGHFGLHRARSRWGGSGVTWQNLHPREVVYRESVRRRRPHPGPTQARRRAAKERRELKAQRRMDRVTAP